MRWNESYRPDIDGLRAIAVISVLLFHFGFRITPGGFIGVDVFFVISGFLITSIIWTEAVSGRFSPLGFYHRRIRRILPALLVMLVVTISIGYVLQWPGDYAASSDSARYAAFGASNFYFYWHTGYFDQSADLMPLLHTWSLGVEEQFYVVWPVFIAAVAFVAQGRKLIVVIAIACVIAVSFLLSLQLLATDPKGAFFFPHTRAWELALGGLLIFLPRLSVSIGEIANVFGVLMISVPALTLSPDQPFPGWSALWPCCGAALVIWPKAETWTGRALGTVRGIGLISYSLYLWHWPILVSYRLYVGSDVLTTAEAVSLAALSIIVGWISYQFIEQPFRQKKWTRRGTVAAGLAAAAAVGSLASLVFASDGFPSRIPASLSGMQSLDLMWKWNGCRTTTAVGPIPSELSGFADECEFGAPWSSAKIKAVLWGDSHASHFAPLIEPFAKDADASVLLFTSCPAILDGVHVNRSSPSEPSYSAKCGAWRSKILRDLRQHPEINIAVLASSWSYLPRLLYDSDPSHLDAGSGAKIFESALDRTITDIGPERTVIVIGSVPQWPQDPLPCELTTVLLRACRAPVLTRAAALAFQQPTYDAILRAAARHPNSRAILPAIKMCKSGDCVGKLNDEFLYRDASHIRRNLNAATIRELGTMIGLNTIFSRMTTANARP